MGDGDGGYFSCNSGEKEEIETILRRKKKARHHHRLLSSLRNSCQKFEKLE
jgi:hypothetical protein